MIAGLVIGCDIFLRESINQKKVTFLWIFDGHPNTLPSYLKNGIEGESKPPTFLPTTNLKEWVESDDRAVYQLEAVPDGVLH